MNHLDKFLDSIENKFCSLHAHSSKLFRRNTFHKCIKYIKSQKHVMFVDKLGFDLAEFQHNSSSIQPERTSNAKFIPMFSLDNQNVQKRLFNKKICLSSVDVSDLSIRGTILTIGNCHLILESFKVKTKKNIKYYQSGFFRFENLFKYLNQQNKIQF